MELRPEFLLPAMAKTLRDVVLPALDPAQQVAQEQLNLAIGFLDILALRLPLTFAFDLDETRRHLALAKALAGLTGMDGDGAIATADAVLEASPADPAALLAACRALRSATCAIIEAGHARGEPALSASISKVVNTFAEVQLMRERAWVAPMGFENGADPIPTIEAQLAVA